MSNESPDFLLQVASRDVILSKRWSIARRPGLWRSLAIAITHTGDSLSVLFLLGLLITFGSPAWRWRATMLLAADVVTFAIVQTLKRTVRRPRPEGVWGKMYRRTDPNSFPSGHSARGGAIAGMGLAVGVLAGPVWLAAVTVVWGLLVACSRVAMAVHYVSDALVGLLVGLSVAGAITLIVF